MVEYTTQKGNKKIKFMPNAKKIVQTGVFKGYALQQIIAKTRLSTKTIKNTHSGTSLYLVMDLENGSSKPSYADVFFLKFIDLAMDLIANQSLW